MSPHIEPLFAGIDIGTSGCRAIVIDERGEVRHSVVVELPAPLRDGHGVEQSPALWWQALQQLCAKLWCETPPQRIAALALDGTSGTMLVTDHASRPLGPALMYNDGRALAAAALIKRVAPPNSAAHGATSGLAKLIWLQEHYGRTAIGQACHQSDWLLGQLLGHAITYSDVNNSLKTGYDPFSRAWPAWLEDLGIDRRILPTVRLPGTAVGFPSPAACVATGLSASTQLIMGTTDSTAAFIATGAKRVGEAVTSLGSTLVTKVLSHKPIFAPEFGVYSQPLGDLWLVGGSSNSGGAVLRHYFSDAQMATMTAALNPDQPTGLNYYPLLNSGERFPHCDPHLAPRLTPRPESDLQFFQGLLEGIARIEQASYQRLSALGAPYPTTLYTVGGGAVNPVWATMRANMIGAPLLKPLHHAAAYGVATLARAGVMSS